jgi:hypothetical protein
MSKRLDLAVVPAQPYELDLTWYDEIRSGLAGQVVEHAGRMLDVGCGCGERQRWRQQLCG